MGKGIANTRFKRCREKLRIKEESIESYIVTLDEYRKDNRKQREKIEKLEKEIIKLKEITYGTKYI